MDTLLHVGASNALVAIVLAVPAAAVSRWGRRPALAHGLWLLVLLKLLTPPLIALPLPSFCAVAAVGSWGRIPILPVNAAGSESCPTPVPQAITESTPDRDEPLAPLDLLDPVPLSFEDAAPTSVPASEPLPVTAAALDPPPEAQTGSAWDVACPALIGAWLVGSMAWLGLVVFRVHQFQRLLRHAESAPADLKARAQQMAQRLGLRSCPAVLLVPGAVAPMLWGLMRSLRLLLPAELLERLDGPQRDTLLAHELAHLRRRDHWVRVLELLATGVFWWHPIVWWARRELREAEEQCCDAWVVWSLPEAAKSYALALVETVDFLADVRRALPPAASGIGPTRLLQRRLTMIMRDTPPRALSVGGVLAVLGLAALLPLMPQWAQAEPPPVPPVRRVVAEPVRPAEDPKRAAEIDKAQAELKKLSEELDRRRTEMHDLEMKFQEVARRLAELGVRDRLFFQFRVPAPGVQPGPAPVGAPLPPAGMVIHPATAEDPAVLRAERAQREAQAEEAQTALQFAEAKLQRLKKLAASGAVTTEVVDEAANEVAIQKARLKARMAELQEITARIDVAERHRAAGLKAPVRETAPATAPARPTGGVIIRTAPSADNDQRLQDVERKLADLLRELEGLRKEMRRPAAPPAPPAERDLKRP